MSRVKNIMQANVPTLRKDSKIEEAARLLAQQESGCVVVVEGNKPVGIVTELDFLRKVISKGRKFRGDISEVMSTPVTCMTPKMKLDEALKIIDTKDYRKYPVVENEQLVGLVTKKDIINDISYNLKFHRNIQNIVLMLFVLFELGVFAYYGNL